MSERRRHIAIPDACWRELKHRAVDADCTLSELVVRIVAETRPPRVIHIPFSRLPDKGKHLKAMIAAQEKAAREGA